MAYLVSQLRKNGNQTYMTPISVSPGRMISPNTFGGSETFIDFALEGSFVSGQVYYLRFQIHKIPKYFYSGSKTPQEVSMYEADADTVSLQILLKNNDQDETDNPPEIIGTCTVPTALQTESDKYSSYSFVFSPSKNFNKLGFRINRVSFDAINTTDYRKWLTDEITDVSDLRYTTSGTRITVATVGDRIKYTGDDGDICSLVNLVQSTPANLSGFLKFGYQSRPGSLIVVNGEPIRVGRSGIYEINNGTIIKSFMIASPNGSDNENIDAFLLDYAYKS